MDSFASNACENSGYDLERFTLCFDGFRDAPSHRLATCIGKNASLRWHYFSELEPCSLNLERPTTETEVLTVVVFQ